MRTRTEQAPQTIDLRERHDGGDRDGHDDRVGRDRGRQADAPQQIPPAGWKDVAVRVKAEAKDDNITLVAAGIAFFALLSLVPAMVAAISVYGLVSTPEDVARNLEDLTSTMPEEARRSAAGSTRRRGSRARATTPRDSRCRSCAGRSSWR